MASRTPHFPKDLTDWPYWRSIYVSDCLCWEIIEAGGPWYDCYYMGVHQFGTTSLIEALAGVAAGKL